MPPDNIAKVPRAIFHAIMNDPSYLLNRGVVKILLNSLTKYAFQIKTRFFFARRTFWYVFYYGFAQHLPASYRFQPLGKFAKWCRAKACKRLFRFCGQHVNVEKGANFYTGWEIEIGDNSSLGIDCMVPYDLKVGRDVMMGPYVIIVGENHQFIQPGSSHAITGIQRISTRSN